MSESHDTQVSFSDHIQRFTFAELPVRGEIVSLKNSFAQICDQHQYSDEIRHLLGQALAACVLMTDIIKIEGKVSLQLQSSSIIKLLLVECDHEGYIRGVLHTNEQTSTDFNFQQWSKGGQMAITIDPDKGQRYQGVVPLEQESLSACIEDYFTLSEQLPTHIRLFADHQQVMGIFLQALPDDDNQPAFEHVYALADTISQEEALTLGHQDLLYRLFHQDQVSLYPSKAINFKCSCSREKNISALMTIEASELLALVKEQNGDIEMVCDFCSNAQIFTEQDIINLVTQSVSSNSIN